MEERERRKLARTENKQEEKKERTNELEWQVGPGLWFPTFPT